MIDGPVLLGAARGSRLSPAIARVLAAIDADVHTPVGNEVRTAAADAGLEASIFNAEVAPSDQTFKALVFDASGIASSDELHEAWAFFHPTIRRVQRSGRVIVLGTPPEACDAPPEAIAQRALEGLVRSIGKEVRRGATAQLVYVAPGAEDAIESTLRFLLSPRSAYVSGQVIRIGAPVAEAAGTGDRLGAAAGRQGRARDRRLARDRRGDRRGAGARRRPRGRARRARRRPTTSRPWPAGSAAPR